MRNFLFGIRTRALLLAAFGAAVFLVTSAYHALDERRLRLEFVKDHLASTATLISAETRNDIKTAGEIMGTLISTRELGRFIVGEQCPDALASTATNLPQFANVLLALPDGRVICSASPLPRPLNIADRPYFQTALKSTGMVISQAFEGRVTGKWVLPLYRTLRDDAGRVQGIIAVGLELEWLNHKLASSTNPEGSRLGLIDSEGRVLARHPDPEGWVGRNASETLFFRAVKALGGEGVVEAVGFDGVRRVYGLARVASTAAGPITLWVGVAADSITAEAERHFLEAVIGASVLLLLTFAVIWTGSEYLLLRPISILSRTARRLGTGDLNARTGIGSTRDEMGMLARSFDEMAASLEIKNRQIVLAERALKVLSAWNRVLLKPGDESALAGGMCSSIVDAGGYRMAWVGYAQDDPDRSVRMVASAGAPTGFVDGMRITWADTEHGRGPAGKVIRNGTVVVLNNYLTNPETAPWRENARRYGFTSIIGLPLKVEDRTIGALVIYAAEPEAFGEQEAVLLAEVAAQLSSAISAQRSRVERARLEVSLRSSEERFRAAAEASLDALFLLKSLRDSAGNIVDLEFADMNARAERRLGLARANAIGKTVFELLPRHLTASFFDVYARVAATGSPYEGEFPLDAPHRERRWFRQQVVPVGEGIAVSLRDITAWKKAGDKLRQSEERLRLAMGAARMGAWQWDLGSDQYSLSEEMLFLWGLAPGAGARSSEDLFNAVHPADREVLVRAMTDDRTAGTPDRLEFRVVWPDGTVHWLEAHSNVIRDAPGTPAQSVGVVMDITQRKQAEIALERATRALRTLSAGNAELVHATTESGLLQAVCRVIVETGGYRSVSVGYPKEDPDKSITLMAWAGAELGYVTVVRRTWADTEEGQRPIARAIRTGSRAISRNIPDDPAFAPIRHLAAQFGCVSNLALPLLDGAQVIGAMSIHAEEMEAFDEAEIRLLEELAEDLAYGIRTLRTRAERDRIADAHQHHDQILRRSLEDSIQAIASTVEMRDPYTSGHQKRVAGLAVAIARSLGLDDERIHGVHLAGVVHDLGKIMVPAEILSKPGKLTAIEYQLIKAHAQAGYDILKDIKFPWPIATIVWEHHERLDGSGYPRGLKGGELLLESRIMAVADVVEAMASHRPYRPSLGIGPALQEIERGRGTAYDPAAVDACLKLFRDDGFELQT